MFVAVTGVAEMFLLFHCESHKHASGLLQIRYRDAGLLLRITPGNTIDGGGCVDLELAIIGAVAVMLFVNSR